MSGKLVMLTTVVTRLPASGYPLPTSFLTLLEGKQDKGCREGHIGED
jgi:hypothetical protein